MPKTVQDPFVRLVEDLLKFTPDFRARAMALAAMHDSMPVPPVVPQAAPAKPKPAAKAPVAVQAKPKKRGRKKGSKNKPKQATQDPVAQSFHQVAESV